jgi:hypothetical protein
MKYMTLIILVSLAILFSNTGFASPNLEATKKYASEIEEEAGVIAECLKRRLK